MNEAGEQMLIDKPRDALFQQVHLISGLFCLSNGFPDTFYRLFLDSSAEVRVKFANTGFVRLKRALMKSLVFMIK